MHHLARQLLPLLLLCSLPHLTWAEESAQPANAAEGETVPSEAADSERMPLPERSAVDSQALQQQLELKEQQSLQAGAERFLALWLPANTGEPSGVVILLPGDDESADWPLGIGPLRRKLPNAGWHSLSLTLPDPGSDAPPLRSAEPQTAAAAEDAPAATPSDADDTNTTQIDSAETAARNVKNAEEQQKAHAERVLARIASAIGFAEQQQARSIVLLGHGSGAYWAARYLAERKPATIKNLLLVAAQLPAGHTPPLDELIPQLQLATGDFYYKDLPADRQAALKRSQASKRQKHPSYIQIAMKALPGNREAEQEQLYRRIKGWLSLKLQAK